MQLILTFYLFITARSAQIRFRHFNADYERMAEWAVFWILDLEKQGILIKNNVRYDHIAYDINKFALNSHWIWRIESEIGGWIPIFSTVFIAWNS